MAGLSLLIAAGRIMKNESLTRVNGCRDETSSRSRDWKEGVWVPKKERELQRYL